MRIFSHRNNIQSQPNQLSFLQHNYNQFAQLTYVTEKLSNGQKYQGWQETFRIESEADLYRLRLRGDSSGNMTRFQKQNDQAFSTQLRENDVHEDLICTDFRHAGFWWNKCGQFNPHGIFQDGGKEKCMGIQTTPPICVKYIMLMIRRKLH